jgi:hypothetical protein
VRLKTAVALCIFCPTKSALLFATEEVRGVDREYGFNLAENTTQPKVHQQRTTKFESEGSFRQNLQRFPRKWLIDESSIFKREKKNTLTTPRQEPVLLLLRRFPLTTTLPGHVALSNKKIKKKINFTFLTF